MIPYGRQSINDDDIKAVIDALTSDYLTQGPAIPAFEAAVAAACEVKHALAVNSATSALHIACMALGLGQGDWLWTVPNTFVASANAGLYCGANVDFVDIDPRTYVMCADALAAKLEAAERDGTLPKIIMPVHFAGQSADMVRISVLAKKYGARVIEDASHCIGGRYLDAPIGACTYSDICVFSFHPVKIITTGEGGVATTNDDELATKLGLYRSHGVTRDPKLIGEKTLPGGWYYEQVDLGYNYRMTDIQGALGVSQMKRLHDFIARRHVLADRYVPLLADLPLVQPYQCPNSYSALHLYPIQVDNRAQVYNRLREAGIGVNVHYIPVHTQPYWRRRGFDWGQFPNAENYYNRAVSIPLFQGMTDQDQDTVVAALKAALDA